jgi:RNA methyltransferase, TrmH family
MYSLKFARTLQDKKIRKEFSLFLVEWEKSILEAFHTHMDIVHGFFSSVFSEKYAWVIGTISHEIVSEKDIQKATSLASNTSGILIVRMKKWDFSYDIPNERNLLVLDGINDPWNLWTIIRIADWYGIDTIITSPDTVDAYNPKTIIASMWSFTRVSIFQMELVDFLQKIEWKRIYGAYLWGESIYTKDFLPGVLVIGSESHGIRPYIESYITDKITIPRIWEAESLNAGIATGIILDSMIGRNMA